MGKNLKKYKECFLKAFPVNENEIVNLKYQDIPEWDSIGHMNLIATIEDEFEVELDIDDITELSDFNEGKKILQKYEIVFEN
jgi:acyl carrier protein